MTHPISHIGKDGWIAVASELFSVLTSASIITERLFDIIDISYAPLYISTTTEIDPDEGEFLGELTTFIGVPPNWMDAVSYSGEDLAESWRASNWIILGSGPSENWIQILGGIAQYGGAEDLFSTDRLILAAGGAAAALGQYSLQPNQLDFETGLNWIPGALILPKCDAPGELPAVKDVLMREEGVYAIGLPETGMLAIGPHGMVEAWSRVPPVITLEIGSG